MNNPGQYLIHMTNRGPKVRSYNSGDVGEFRVYAKQPLKDINKFGLMMYSVPKMIDLMNFSDQSFDITFQYLSGWEITVPVTLPMLDYYSCTHSQMRDESGLKQNQAVDELARRKNVLSMDEILQSSINWAIQKAWQRAWNQLPAGGGNLEPAIACLPRMGCIVRLDPKTGAYNFYFGYKGTGNLVNAGLVGLDGNHQHYAAAVFNNSGAPGPTRAYVPPAGASPDLSHAIAGVANAEYEFIGTDGTHVQGPAGAIFANAWDPWAAQGGGGVVPGVPLDTRWERINLVSVAFVNMSSRLQLMLGMSGANLISSKQLPIYTCKERGHIRLVNYNINTGLPAPAPDRPSGFVEFNADIPPNLDPPSFLYLQLTVPGTRSKILGQSDERGGWALPTTQNQYISQYENLPGGEGYNPMNARSMPAIGDLQEYDLYFANVVPGAGAPPAHVDGIGFSFDPIPITVGGPGGYPWFANWKLTGNNKSRFIIFGGKKNGVHDIGEPVSRRLLRCAYPGSYSPQPALGVGLMRQSAVFTTTLIEPNWVYTSVENATMQTFDVQLLYGDTSEKLETSAGQPVQFTLIASP